MTALLLQKLGFRV